MTTATTTSIASGDTLHIALHHAAATGARSAVGLAGFAGAELRAGGAGQGAAGAGDAGDASVTLTPLVESPLLAAGPLAVPASIGVQLFDLTVGGEVFTAFEERIIARYTEFRSAMGWRYAGLYAVESQGLAHPFARAVGTSSTCRPAPRHNSWRSRVAHRPRRSWPSAPSARPTRPTLAPGCGSSRAPSRRNGRAPG